MLVSLRERNAVRRRLHVIGAALQMGSTIFLLVGLALLVAGVLDAQAPARPPVTRLTVSRAAAVVLDSLATQSRADRVETAACLTAYTVRDTVLTLDAFGPPSHIIATDSVSIKTDGHVMCASGAPALHSHVAYDGYARPSELDLRTTALTGVWALLLSVYDNGWIVRIYP